jgi:hypothetical protein
LALRLFPATFLTDQLSLAHPLAVFTGGSLAAGELPLWNPHWFSGFPHLGLPEAGIWYPTTVLYGLFEYAPTAKIDFLFHFWLLGVFGYLLGRSAFGRRWLALGVGFALVCGPLAFRPYFYGQIWWTHSAAWFPLAFLALRRLVRGGSWRWMPVLSAALALEVLGGALQFFAHSLLILGGYALLECFRLRFEKDESWRVLSYRVVLAAGGVCLALGLAALQLLPSYELARHSVRAVGISSAYFREFRLLPSELWAGLLFERQGVRLAPGALALGLTGLGILSRDGERRTLSLLSAAGVLLALAPSWLSSAMVHVPVLGSFRGNGRLVLVLLPLVTYVAVGGLAELVSSAPSKVVQRRWLGLFTLVSGAAIASAMLGETATPWHWVPAVCVGLLWTATLRRGLPIWTGPFLVVLLAVEGLSQYYDIRSSALLQEPRVPEDWLELRRTKQGADRMAIFERPKLVRTVVANIGAVTGERTLAGYHALLLESYASFLERVAGIPVRERTSGGRHELDRLEEMEMDWVRGANLPVLDLLNIRHLVAVDVPLRWPSRLASLERRFSVSQVGGLTVYENRRALPQAFVLHDFEVAPTREQALARMSSPGFPLRTRAMLEIDPDPRPMPATGQEPVNIRRTTTSAVELDVVMTSPGILVWCDVAYPGWVVVVDAERPRVPLTVDALLKGVALDSGRHSVRFEFRPVSLRAGAALSVLSVLVWLALLGRAWWQHSPGLATRAAPSARPGGNGL